MLTYAFIAVIVVTAAAIADPTGIVDSILRLGWRFLSGAPLDGRQRTDATWWRAGTKSLDPKITRYSRWSARRRAERSWIRISCTILAAMLAWAYLTHPTLTLVLGAYTVFAFGVWQIYRAWTAWLMRHHQSTYIRPLHVAMSAALHLDPHLPADKYIRVPVGFRTSETAESRVYLPETFDPSPAAKKQAEDLVRAKLDVSPTSHDLGWELKGRPYIVLTLAPTPPTLVPWADWIDYMNALPAGEIFLGLDKKKKPYTGSFNIEDPHWGFSVGSRRGKSTQAMSIAAQILHQHPDNQVAGIDPKMTSFDPLIGVPRFTCANHPKQVDQMWALIESIATELDRRMEAESADVTLRHTWPCLALIVDEVNRFADLSADHWKSIKEKGAPATAPIWAVIAGLIWMGAQFNVHVIMYGQRLDARATGGIGLRDGLGFRGLAGFRPQQWLMLVGTAPIPKSQKKRGRFIYSDGQDETWVQNVLPTDQELRDYASTSRPVDVPATAAPEALAPALPMSDVLAGTSSLPALTPGPRTDIPRQATPDTEPAPATVWVVGLAAGAAHVGLSEAAFARRRTRSEGIPGETRQGNQPAWTTEALDALGWAPARVKETSAA